MNTLFFESKWNFFVLFEIEMFLKIFEADVGKGIEVEYEGAYYPAKLKADNGDGTFTIIYDDETFGEETVEKSRIKQEANAAPAASAFSVGPVQVNNFLDVTFVGIFISSFF